MLTTLIDAIVTEFTLSRIVFTHQDVTDCIPDLTSEQLQQAALLVLKKMTRMYTYKICVVHFVGVGTSFLYAPRNTAPDSTVRSDISVEQEHPVI